MPGDKLILAVDLGTSGMKVALVTTLGRVLGWEAEPLRLHILPNGGAEQTPEDWWQAFLKAAGRLLKQKPEVKSAIAAVCCSTQGESTVPVDVHGNALSNCILWLDMRGAPLLRKQIGGLFTFDGADILKIIRYIQLTGGMPSMTGKDGAGHMLLIRDAMPEVYSRTYKFLNVLDYMNLRLCGEFVATFDSIVTSWVTDNRDAKIVRYDDSLIAMLGIDRAKFPDIVPCSTVIGELKADVAAALGLAPGVKVVAGSIDNTASAVGSGAVEDYQVHLYIGTSSWLAAHVPFKKTDLFSSIASIPCALPERYLLTAQQSNAGGNLNFLRDNILYHKDELLQEEKLPDVFKIMDRIAESTPAGSNGVLYTPWIWGERAPVDDKHLRAGLYNIGLHNTRADIIRAFLEGVALNTRWMLGPVEKFLERKATLINLTGGGASSDIWCQIFADVMNVTVRQVKDAIQSNARGAAWIASAGLGEISFTDVPNLIEYKRVYTPTPAHRQVYDERFAAFVSVHRQMRGVYKRMNP